LLNILELMPRIAMATPWARRTVSRMGWTELAARYYVTLQEQCPDSPEALRAARPGFSKPADDDQPAEPAPAVPPGPEIDPFNQETPDWTGPSSDYGMGYLRHREFRYDDIAGFGSGEPSGPPDSLNDLLQELYAMDFSSPDARKALLALRERSRQTYTHWRQGCVHSAIEDLTALAGTGLVKGDVFARCANLRLSVINVCSFQVSLDLRPFDGNLTSGPEADSSDFRRLDARGHGARHETRGGSSALPAGSGLRRTGSSACLPLGEDGRPVQDESAGETTVDTRDYAAVEKEALAWLGRPIPAVPSREEAWLLCLRAAYRARRPLLHSVAADFPSHRPQLGGTYVRIAQPNQLPWDAAVIAGTGSRRYEKEFPKPPVCGGGAGFAPRHSPSRGGRLEAGTRALHRSARRRGPSRPPCGKRAGDSRTLSPALAAASAAPEIARRPRRASPRAREFLIQYLDTADELSEPHPLEFLSNWLRERCRP